MAGLPRGYALRLRNTAGAMRSAVVTANGRTGPAGHRVFADGDGGLLVEIACTGEHRVLSCLPGWRVVSASSVS